MSATKRWVDAFAREMEEKLDENRHKGDRNGWSKDTAAALLERLEQEVEELRAAVGEIEVGRVSSRALQRRIREEAADVGNFADVGGGMLP